MRELEFLPDWYPQWRRRRRGLLLEVWMAIVLALGLGLWTYLAHQNVARESAALGAIRGQLRETNTQLEKIDRLEVLRRQWRRQAEVLGRLGVRVETNRLMEKLAAALPPEMALVGLDVETEETNAVGGAQVVAGSKYGNSTANNQLPTTNRWLKVRLQGVAPTDVELATFLTELNKVPFFEKVSPTYSRDRHEAGHVMREFELTFCVNLNLPAGS